MQASIILPIIAVISLFLKVTFGIEIGEELQQQIADVAVNATLVVISVFGIVKAHRSKQLTNLK